MSLRFSRGSRTCEPRWRTSAQRCPMRCSSRRGWRRSRRGRRTGAGSPHRRGQCLRRAPARRRCSRLIDDPVGIAVRLDAACVVVNILQLPDQPEIPRLASGTSGSFSHSLDTTGMPLMVETARDEGHRVVRRRRATSKGHSRWCVRRWNWARTSSRPTRPRTWPYHKVVETAAGVPVLVRGGGRAPDEVIFNARSTS